MLNAVNDAKNIYVIKCLMYHLIQIDFLLMKYRLQPLRFDLSLDYGEDKLYRIKVWRVYWGKDALDSQLRHSLSDIVALVHREIVKIEAKICEEVFSSQLLNEDLELHDVDGLLECHHQIDSHLC